jgi:hypothetical protein
MSSQDYEAARGHVEDKTGDERARGEGFGKLGCIRPKTFD